MPHYRYYAGIGSRDTPEHVLEFFTELASFLEQKGWILRSGGANGADAAFEAGVKNWDAKEIYLPWKGFNGNGSTLHLGALAGLSVASSIMERYHPNPSSLGPAARKLMIRNSYQVLGGGLSDTSSRAVVCWTNEGKVSGGTGQALRIAQSFNIPIFNLGSPTLDWKHFIEHMHLEEFEGLERFKAENVLRVRTLFS